ncbi:MAG: bifunctional DNA primase/polymerase [Thermoleophilia bacterium]|nr:bifunctional DNA primase/polymerase [Thermoleophilia bacterium]MDH3724710.1 bifunctional DNA primase/polymerase [Thermoleophilia bacterium]
MTPEVSLAAKALAYAELGWAVVPVHTPRGEVCSCSRRDCPSVGKHPRVRWQAFSENAPRLDQVRSWWRRWPDANVAVITGAVSGLAVIDVDPRSGGDRACARLEERWGSLPPTPETLTGGGGRHLWFDTGDASLPSAIVSPGLELKAAGAAVVAPPSLHASGRRYEWIPERSPWEMELAPPPDWLRALAQGAEIEHGPRHPLGDPGVRTQAERDEFADVWLQADIEVQAGDRYYKCPFHEDHHPSLHIDADGCRWYCFGCRRGGGTGVLRRLLGDGGRPRTRERLSGAVGPRERVTLLGTSEVDVVGESHHQDELLDLTGGGRRYGGVDVGAVAHLTPEPGNRFDPDAVAVMIGTLHVGYLRHADAVRLRPMIDAALRAEGAATCRAVIRGGWDRGHGDVGAFGVVVLLPAPE